MSLARAAGVLAGLLWLCGAAAASDLLAPFKDDLFAYPARLAEQHGGRHVTIDYRVERDLRQRDEVPERRAHRRYVDPFPRRSQADRVIQAGRVAIRHVTVGPVDGARFVIVYLHGRGGNRQQGMNDNSFGGNFNRLKNLAARNGGLYLTSDFSDFGAEGAAQIAGLADHYLARSPGARLFLACGSMGGMLCWRLADDARLAPRLGGLILLGSLWNQDFLRSRAFHARVPVLFGHGGDDKVYPVAAQEALFRSILARVPGYPARFIRFETGSHGTPIRMTDWRDTLNWMNRAP